MDFVRIGNHEKPRLESEDFPFKLFLIKNLDTPAHWHNHSEIFFLKKGSCSVYIDGDVIQCNKGDILFIPPDSLHCYIADKTAEYYAMVVGSSLFDSMKNDKHFNTIVTPFITKMIQTPIYIDSNSQTYLEFRQLIENIIVENNRRNIGFELLLKMEICKFFTNIKRTFKNLEKELSPKENMVVIKMKSVVKYISNHYSEKITINDMATLSNMSNQHFCRIFKSYTGTTLIEYITELRLEKANFLLKETNLPITTIPELTGFCNSNYFARIYKRKYTCTPSFTRKRS
ncbi:MAG: AraC family transcriptional regulator [Spirochaetaceae bacterium]